MKKLIVSIIAVLYFTVTSGMVVNFHFCKGKLSSIDFNVSPNKSCACKVKSKFNKNKSCCKSEYKVVKLNNLHNATYSNIDCKRPFYLAQPAVAFFQIITPKIATGVLVDNIVKPPISYQKAYIINCVFRI